MAGHMTTASQQSTPKISIVTVVKNGDQFIADTIQSVVKQNYLNKEYIIIDGGSTDGTLDIIRSVGEGITHWISEADFGIADAFNKGLALATGDYILFLNSDDALANSGVLKAVAREVTNNDQPELVYGDYNVLNRESGVVRYRGEVKFSPQKIRYGQVLPHPCLFTRRSYFDKYGTFDRKFSIAMDYEWLLRGIAMERVLHLPMIITNIRDGGISALDQALATEEIILALRKNGYIPTVFSEYKIRGYFFIRAISRKLLVSIGLYTTFVRARN